MMGGIGILLSLLEKIRQNFGESRRVYTILCIKWINAIII